jgi:protease PrsW
MNLIFSFFPVTLFMVFLFLLDSFNLVHVRTLIICLLWGVVCAVASYFMNTAVAGLMEIDYKSLSLFIGPVIEEIFKSLIILYFITRRKIGFMIDAAIYGFAVGAMFSLVENLTFIYIKPDIHHVLISLIRGFGTGIMHGGCTSIFAVILIAWLNQGKYQLVAALPALVVSIVLHSGFNHFLLNPIIQTLLILTVLPVIFILVFRFSKTRLQKWLEIEFFSEIEMLNMFRRGEFGNSPSGLYLKSLKEQFSPDTIVDMYCYIELYLELSIKAKRNLMLKENDFPVTIEEDLPPKLTELAALRKRIGKIGELALSPLIRMNYRNLWKLNQLV